MQGLGEKRALFKDFNFTSNEDTCWFLRGWKKETVINRFEKAEINFDVQQAAIVDFDDSFKDLQEKVNELEISWSINSFMTGAVII